VRSYPSEFFKAEFPPRDNYMNVALIRSLAQGTRPYRLDHIEQLLAEHSLFLGSGGSGSRFDCMQVAGMPMNIYKGAASKGKQWETRMKHFAASTDLSNCTISYADFAGCLAEEVNFEASILDFSLLRDAFLMAANFDNCSAEGTDFTGSDLTGASFINANLSDSNFEIANRIGVDFRGALLEGACFKGTNLDGIRR
jgi:hypothetical protein